MNAVSGSGTGHGNGRDYIGGLGYGIGVSVGILLLITAFTLASYLCTRGLQVLHPTGVGRRPAHQPQTPLEEQFTVVEVGLDEATIRSYPRLLYAEAMATKAQQSPRYSSTDTSCCSICLMDYKAADELRVLPECSHLFHQKCVDPWLRLHATCPVCRNSPMPTPFSTPLAEVVPLASHRT
ncbi:putative RING-H2 finger protein ATL71 [Punica granatum]|uniref:RING-type E3 ubiquitin transferase n=2 Tax=Punica granatum TaxID=22663 RepID=A0A218X3U7_PUNGR|nr:putative RING-H2 finger protein ATL71 [Punica granatum]OWM79022.1 hypothetical protein CDL15_Pgr003193 [Punica granatum]PKI42961.1 hypothetical protein CRG98_036759 [Punica granatum]